MFTKIMVPVDLVHEDRAERALQLASDLSRQYDAPITVVTVGGELPSELGHNPNETQETVRQFAQALEQRFGVTVEGKAVMSTDPTIDTTRSLMNAIEQTGADLVVVASHKPGVLEHIFSSHGGYIAQHAKVSVFVVR